MSEQNTQIKDFRPRILNALSVFGVFTITGLVALPIVSVFVLAATGQESVLPRFLTTTMSVYFVNTVTLMVAVGVLAAVVGVSTAWLVTVYRFPFRRVLEWALFMPLSIPAYVGAYALVDFLEFAGPVQTVLRNAFGWSQSGDYYFPQIRTIGGATFVLTMALFPYVYLLARAAFKEQSRAAFEVAQTLGLGQLQRFVRVAIPLARPSIFAGIAIVMMETAADFGAVEYFAVQTLTTGIFSVWLEGNNVHGAAQISTLMLIIVFSLFAIEKASRRRIRFHRNTRRPDPIVAIPLGTLSGWLATIMCFLPFAFGFLLPAGVICWHAIPNRDLWLSSDLYSALLNTLFAGGAAAVISVGAATLMVYGIRLAANGVATFILPFTSLGYAAPGSGARVGNSYPDCRFRPLVCGPLGRFIRL